MTGDRIPHDEPPWGQYAPGGVFAALLAASRSTGDSALARLALWAAPDAADIETLGFRARLHPKDNLSEKRALLTPRRFDPAELAFLSRALPRDFIFIDIGANCGVYSLHLAARGDAGARLVAVEPQPEMLRRLRFNIAANAFQPRIRVMAAAISDSPGEVSLHINRHNRGESGLGGAGEAVTVAAMTLVQLMDETGIGRADAIKIDVEGEEMRILARFFADAPADRHPDLLLLESLHASAARDPVALALDHGYAIVLDTGRNVILRREGSEPANAAVD